MDGKVSYDQFAAYRLFFADKDLFLTRNTLLKGCDGVARVRLGAGADGGTARAAQADPASDRLVPLGHHLGRAQLVHQKNVPSNHCLL